MITLDQAREALQFVSSDERDVWVRMAMALKSEFGEDAFHIWDSWSMSSDSYKASSAKAVWKSCSAGGRVTIGSLLKAAHDGGWRDSGFHVAEDPDVVASRQRKKAMDAAREEERRQKLWKLAADRAQSLIKRASLSTHIYLRSKQFPDETGLVLPEGVLLVPMRDIRRKVVGGQLIWWNSGEQDEMKITVPDAVDITYKNMREKEEGFVKMFIPSTKAGGACYRVGSEDAAHTILCEGYVTALSVYYASRMIHADVSVLACFSAGNIATVAKIISGSRGIYADNDESKVGETYARKSGLPYVMSNTVGYDANDDHREYGKIDVGLKIRKLIQLMR